MAHLIHQFIEEFSRRLPNNIAICHKDKQITYEILWLKICESAEQFRQLGIVPGDRVAIYLPKLPETLYAFFGATLAGASFVPINPLLKPHQVAHILQDSGSKLLISSQQRLKQLQDKLEDCIELEQQLAIDGEVTFPQSLDNSESFLSVKNDSLAAILYTSGSTGKPKGVMLTHRNLVVGAESVSEYLQLTEKDRLLAVLPLSFDYGLNQVTSSFSIGARVVLLDYLLPKDVIRAVERYQVTGLAAVPPLWQQLAALDWPDSATTSLRYFTNSGGAMPLPTLAKLREIFPQANPYLMYGLTEAFRSTYLPPKYIDQYPESIGKAIPNAKILILREDGSECDVDENGELVHLGELVSPGYWKNPQKTSKRFKPVAIENNAIGVWSGDEVYRNAAGFMFFVSRMDEMIKTSGYRVSPGEIETELLQHNEIIEAVVVSAPHPKLGEGIIAIIRGSSEALNQVKILKYCKQQLANFMVPHHIEIVDIIPRNANGKVDRALLKQQYKTVFMPAIKEPI